MLSPVLLVLKEAHSKFHYNDNWNHNSAQTNTHTQTDIYAFRPTLSSWPSLIFLSCIKHIHFCLQLCIKPCIVTLQPVPVALNSVAAECSCNPTPTNDRMGGGGVSGEKAKTEMGFILLFMYFFFSNRMFPLHGICRSVCS